MIGLTVIVTDGFVDAVLLMLAAGLLVASHAARRYARDVLLYRNREPRWEAADETDRCIRPPRNGHR